MDPRLESVVESLYPVGGEEEDPLEVFQESKEDANQRVAVDILDQTVAVVLANPDQSLIRGEIHR